MRALCRELAARSPHAALVLMHGRGSLLAPRGSRWQEELVLRVAAEEHVTVLETRPALLAAIGGDPAHVDELYVPRGPGAGHWNRTGNMAAFEALRAFVAGEPPERALERVATARERGLYAETAPRLLARQMLGCALEVGWRESGGELCFAQSRDEHAHALDERLALRAGDLGPTELRWTMPAGAKRFRARLRAVGGPGKSGRVVVLRASWVGPQHDGQGQSFALAPGDEPREWTIELGPGILSLNLESPGPGLRTPWLLFESPAIERD